MKTLVVFATLTLALPVGAAWGQPPGEPGFERYLLPPDLVMRHQHEIGLTPEQRQIITTAITTLQARVVELQWDMQNESQQLAELVRKPSIDEPAALEQVDRMLSIEREIKRAHLTMLIQVKNALSADQQRRLEELRGSANP